MADPTFKDHFSTQSSDYQKFRPVYPEALYKFLAVISPTSSCAWDCATGNGQAATGLGRFFDRVIATDASSKQLAHAMTANNIDYQLARAEQTAIADNSIDLITVAQALHWFDIDGFFLEAKRVLKDQGIIAVWSYNLLSISPDIDQVIYRLYAEILHDYWPAERKMIENGYSEIAFPFSPVASPQFAMQALWNLHDLTGYLQTWSAVQHYIAANGVNPVHHILPALESLWRDGADTKIVNWPLRILLGQYRR